MSENDGSLKATTQTAHESHPLDYGWSYWRESSQRAANLHNQGHKLWTKHDLRDIEQQITQSVNRKIFTVRAIDGNIVSMKNLNYGERHPIWKPYVKYQEYWQLVNTPPSGPPETYHCSYLVDWANETARDFRGIMSNANLVFEETKIQWKQSQSCKLLESQLRDQLGAGKVTKIICCGLGDMYRKPPEWFKRRTGSTADVDVVRPSMVQHLFALTMTEVLRNMSGEEVKLLAQDPDYTKDTIEILETNGFSVVGQFGAGGFAEIDDDSVVLSAFIRAPLKQIIADIARPIAIMSTGFTAFNDQEKPWADADSPRTEEMWHEYHDFNFHIGPGDEELMSKLQDLHFYVRK
ncbi:hypothetical protein FSARC_14852 [Fusarium sarcochroum]|uniref:SRR1-like domain-containing protein n=1 Tax=Fusarium sarcochroum TaxID=1208366 RepID=A0A8H4WN30_9HYPO|nr:hypothetical protein FSARC_14852 [Fusarium sarcochroum]